MSDKELTREELLRETLRKTTCMTYDVIDSLLAQLSNGNDTDKEVAFKHIAWHIPTGGPKMTAAGENGKLLAKQALLDEIKAIYMDGTEPEDPEGGEDETPEEPEEKTATEVIDDIKSGSATLESNLDMSEASTSNLFLSDVTTEINLNGFAIENAKGGTSNAVVHIKNDSDVTIKNGTIEGAVNQGNGDPIVLLYGGAPKLTLEDVTVDGKGVGIWQQADKGSEVVIKSGNYASTTSHAIYVGGSNNNVGKITIEGGTFGKPGVEAEWLLNIQDPVRKDKDPRDYIEVKGGTFYNFNPANNPAEGEGTNFVADGYEVEESGDEGNKVYTVVPAKTNSTMDVE